jgi:hypothetical protein
MEGQETVGSVMILRAKWTRPGLLACERARGGGKKEEISGAREENLWAEKWVGRVELYAHRPGMRQNVTRGLETLWGARSGSGRCILATEDLPC